MFGLLMNSLNCVSFLKMSYGTVKSQSPDTRIIGLLMWGIKCKMADEHTYMVSFGLHEMQFAR